MNKTKSFTLESGYGNGFGWSIISTILSNGTFHGKGDFQIRDYKLLSKKYPKKLFNVISGCEKGIYWEFSISVSNKGAVYISLFPFVANISKYQISKYQSYKDGQKRCRAKRSRKLGFHKISFPLDVEFDWHHVNTNDVVAMSRYIHRAIRHELKIKNCLEGVVG